MYLLPLLFGFSVFLSLPPIPVSLVGFGSWAKKRFFPILKVFHEWGVIELTVIDLFERPPDLPRTIDYMPWSVWGREKRACRVAFVVCSSQAHFEVCRELMELPSLKVLVCEKPFCVKRAEAVEIFKVAKNQRVSVIICDHYLLREEAAAVNAENIRSLGRIVKVRGCLNEKTADGPHIGVGVVLDLMIHLIDWLHILFPQGRFEPKDTMISPSSDGDYPVYAWVSGHYYWLNGCFPVDLESGKEMPEDEKSIEILGTEGEIRINLKEHRLQIKNQEGVQIKEWKDKEWNYSRLILLALFGSLL